MMEEWVDLGGDPDGVKVYIEGFEQSFRRMAGKRLPPDLRLATSLMRSHMEDLLASKVDARETFGITAAEEAATGAETEVAKAFESRIDEQVTVIKE